MYIYDVTLCVLTHVNECHAEYSVKLGRMHNVAALGLRAQPRDLARGLTVCFFFVIILSTLLDNNLHIHAHILMKFNQNNTKHTQTKADRTTRTECV